MASGLFYCGSIEECPVSHHQISDFEDDFLEACFLCQRSLAFNRDIFMYRGNKAFCSDDCRQEQIDHDEAMERRRNISARAMRKTGNSSSAKQATTGTSTATSAARSTVAGAVSVA